MRIPFAPAFAGHLVVLVFVLTPARLWAGLFEDEIGQYEWMLQQVGRPTALAYSADATDRIFVASASGVVASMLLKDGTLQWRRTSAAQGSVRLLRAGSRGLLSVMDHGFVQAWQAATGDLTWQREYPDMVIDLFIAAPGSKQSVAIVRESEVEVRTMAGKQEWSVTSGLSTGIDRFWAAALSEDETAVCVLSSGKEGAELTAMQIEVSSGKTLKSNAVPAEVAKSLKAGSFIVADAHLVVLDGDSLSVHPLCGNGQTDAFEMRKVKSKGAGSFQLMPWQRTAGVFAAFNQATTIIFGISGKGLKHLRTFEGAAVLGPVYSVHDDEAGQPVAVAMIREEGTQIQLLDPASGNVQPAINAQGYTATDHGPAQLLLVRELSSGEHRSVISASDHSLAVIQGSKVAWVREEALANIRQAFFHGQSSGASPVWATSKSSSTVSPAAIAAALPAIAAQLSELPAKLSEMAMVPIEALATLTDMVSGVPQAKRPKKYGGGSLPPSFKVPTSAEELRSFGGDKLIIAATDASKIFAIESTTSAIVWQLYFDPGTGLPAECGHSTKEAATNGKICQCNVWVQMLSSSSLGRSQLLVMIPGKQQSLLWLDPLTGKVIYRENAPEGSPMLASMLLPDRALPEKGPLPFLLVDAAHTVHAVPSSHESLKLLESNADRLFYYEVDRSSSVVNGFAVGQTTNDKQLSRLWNLELGFLGERIVAAASPLHSEWDHVPVHIKGDATILHKYINTNVVAVVSVDTSHKGNTSSLNLYVIDAVTGHMLHQSRILGGAEPVHVITCDNWVVMHYWNMKKTRYETTVVELFEAKADDGPWDLLFGGKTKEASTKSAYHLETPVPLQQTYISPAGVTAMGVTATLKGITPRSVVMALTTDHIFRIPKDMLNPRRPMLPANKLDKEKSVPAQFAPTKDEPVMPYAPMLPLKPTDVLSYYHPVGQVDGIISSPTALESTSLIFCYGLDLFFTPVQTAKAYDVLSPGFNYTLLYLSVVVVTVALLVTSYLASNKALQDRWK